MYNFVNKSKVKFRTIACFILMFVLICFDQITKYFVLENLKGRASVPIIKDVFELTFVSNEGIAWGMFSGRINIVVLFTTIITIGLIYLFTKIGLLSVYYQGKKENDLTFNSASDGRVKSMDQKIKRLNILQIVIVVMFSGALGNLIDRITLGYVVDFFNFKLINFPVFNVADIFITVSLAVFIIFYLVLLDDDDIDMIFKSYKKWKSPIQNEGEDEEK
ncbi:MAG: signal peptidase II [Clostridiales bacterium]|nr:signal peptidase II [Clostridiales bacterium]